MAEEVTVGGNMQIIVDLFSSKKFVVALAGIIVQVVAFFSPDIAQMADEILKIVIGYVVGQGIADLGKEAKKIG